MVEQRRNWTGGTPAGDPDADLVFPDVANKTSTNDIAGVTYIKSITLESGGYAIGGNRSPSPSVDHLVAGERTNTIPLPIQVLTSASVSIPNSVSGATLISRA